MSQETYDTVQRTTKHTGAEYLATFHDKSFSLTADFDANTVTGKVAIGSLNGRWLGSTNESDGNRPFWNSMGTTHVILNGSLDPANGKLGGSVGFDGSVQNHHIPNGGGSWEATFYGDPEGTDAPGLVSGVFKADSKDNGMFFDPDSPDVRYVPARTETFSDTQDNTDYARSKWTVRGAFGGAKE